MASFADSCILSNATARRATAPTAARIGCAAISAHNPDSAPCNTPAAPPVVAIAVLNAPIAADSPGNALLRASTIVRAPEAAENALKALASPMTPAAMPPAAIAEPNRPSFSVIPSRTSAMPVAKSTTEPKSSRLKMFCQMPVNVSLSAFILYSREFVMMSISRSAAPADSDIVLIAASACEKLLIMDAPIWARVLPKSLSRSWAWFLSDNSSQTCDISLRT